MRESTNLSYNIRSAETFQIPEVFKTFHNTNGIGTSIDELSSMCSIDTVSPSQKRKLLDCEKGDFEERFKKIQKKKQLLRVAAKANLVIDDDNDSDEENEIYEQMDWIEKENAMIMHSCQNSEENNESFENMNSNSPVLLVPRIKWKEERRKLLKISMAKIRRVEDPESYLRRSVLINNTVKILQKDVSMSLSSLASTSFIQGNITYQKDNHNSWGFVNVICKENAPDSHFSIDCSSSVVNSDAVIHFNNQVHSDVSHNPVHFHLTLASNISYNRTFDMTQSETLNNSAFNKSVLEERRLNETSVTPLILKQASPLHLFSSQPCGLQYRSIVQDEDVVDEYCEPSNTSSILDSVVYHSLVASLET